MKTYLRILIVVLFFLIMRYCFYCMKAHLEGFCSVTGNSDSGCRSIIMNKNTSAIQHTNKSIDNVKERIKTLISNTSKSIDTANTSVKANTANIAINTENKSDMRDALNPVPQ